MDRHISSDAVKAILSNYGLPYHVYPKMWDEINALPSAEEESFEWCTDCKEYDQEAHCCHRYSKMIKKTVEEMQIVRCKDCIYADYMDDIKTFWCSEGGRGKTVTPYDFCSYGEKR